MSHFEPLEHPLNLFHTKIGYLVIMEELQSTEILDREILEDARKKALRLLKQAEDTINSRNALWEKKITEEIKEIEKKYDEQKESEIKSIMARLPVDRLRIKIEKIESLLKSAVDAWYNSQSRDQILRLLSNELSKRLEYCKDQLKEGDTFSVEADGLEQNEVAAVIKSVNENNSFPIQNSSFQIGHSSFFIPHSFYPSITLTVDNIHIIASVEKTIDSVLHDKREELAASLTGSDFLRSE